MLRRIELATYRLDSSLRKSLYCARVLGHLQRYLPAGVFLLVAWLLSFVHNSMFGKLSAICTRPGMDVNDGDIRHLTTEPGHEHDLESFLAQLWYCPKQCP